jgi:putative DNA-invertase from lambdoid prophage Rac
LGRDALDVQSTVRFLLDKGVMLDVRGLGVIGRGAGEIVVAVLAQIADMERQRIKERCDDGRVKARAALAATGKTHRNKVSLGRPMAGDAAEVAGWRKANGKSIRETCEHFGLSKATVARYCAAG